MVHEIEIEVRYAETDKMGVVYHANYLVWFEIARTKFLQSIGIPYAGLEERGLMSPVLKAECEYHSSLTYGDVAVVKVGLVELSGVKTTFAYEVYRKVGQGIAKKPSCTGSTAHCLVKTEGFNPVSMKKEAPDLYEAYKAVYEPHQ